MDLNRYLDPLFAFSWKSLQYNKLLPDIYIEIGEISHNAIKVTAEFGKWCSDCTLILLLLTARVMPPDERGTIQSPLEPHGKPVIASFDYTAVTGFGMPHPFGHGHNQPYCLRIKVRVYGNFHLGICNGTVHLQMNSTNTQQLSMS